MRRKLTNLKLKIGTSLQTHFSIYEDLINQLRSTGSSVIDNEKIAMLLNTFPAIYNGVIVAIETISENELNYDLVKTRLTDYETKINEDNIDTSTKILHVRNTNNMNKKVNYNYHNKNNKYRADQQKGYNKRPFKKIYNPVNGGKFKQNLKNRKQLSCHHCGRKGHMKDDCFYYKRSCKFQQNRTLQTVHITNPSTSQEDHIAFMMTSACEKLIPENTDGINFILDSGATDHIINREDLATNFIKMQSSLKISVAKNGVYVYATKKGSLAVQSDLAMEMVLENVLYCPEVPYNLLSVKKMQEAGLGIYFDKSGVSITEMVRAP